MYTCVLFGLRVGSDAPPLESDVQRRYQALLAAIESSTGTASGLVAAGIPKIETNLFCIPGKSSDPASRPTLDNYNSALALAYRDIALGGLAMDARFREKLAVEPGPFLISSLSPLNEAKTAEPMLFVDLTATNPAAMGEVAATFKRRLTQNVVDRAEVFEPFRLTLLSLILDASENVKLVKEAVAATLPSQ